MKLSIVPLVLVLTVCMINPVAADGPVVVTRISDIFPDDSDLPSLTPGDCVAGNFQNTHLYMKMHQFLGEYFIRFYARGTGCYCPGFRVENVHVLVGTIEPVSFNLEVGWHNMIYFPHIIAGMRRELPVEISEVLPVVLPETGIYEISFPFDGDACAFIEPEFPSPGYTYMLYLGFPELVELIGIASTNPADNSYNINGIGGDCLEGICYADMVGDYGWPGEIVMWGDEACCSPPVPEESLSWGHIKSLYR